MSITYKTDLVAVNWAEMKAVLQQDNFDNDRTREQYEQSFAHSYATCIAYDDNRIISTARALSDDVCNAYIVDVWTLSSYRRQGIGQTMLRTLFVRLSGQHVYLFTDDMPAFYRSVGFQEQPIGMGRVVGRWLHPV